LRQLVLHDGYLRILNTRKIKCEVEIEITGGGVSGYDFVLKENGEQISGRYVNYLRHIGSCFGVSPAKPIHMKIEAAILKAIEDLKEELPKPKRSFKDLKGISGPTGITG